MATTTHAQTTNGVENTKQLVLDLQGTHTLPLWEQMAKYNPPAPNPKAVPHLWKYDELKPHLIRAGELITEKQAERRVLMLINPALGKFNRLLDNESFMRASPNMPELMGT
jgi:gentisate 1,2-dioxygenase